MSQLTDLFTGIANAIRTKSGNTEAIQAADFATAIVNIPVGTPIILIDVLKNDKSGGMSIPTAKGKQNIIITPYNENGWSSNYTTKGVAYIARVNNVSYYGAYSSLGGNPPNAGNVGTTTVWDPESGTIPSWANMTLNGQPLRWIGVAW